MGRGFGMQVLIFVIQYRFATVSHAFKDTDQSPVYSNLCT
jgi:hypothetical protein